MTLTQISLRSNTIYTATSLVISSSTSILPQYSQTMIFFLDLISNCLCGGILLKHPPQASRWIVTTARPFLAFRRIRWYAVNNRGIITYISPAIESFTGFNPSEIIGRLFTEFVYEEDLPGMKKRFVRRLFSLYL